MRTWRSHALCMFLFYFCDTAGMDPKPSWAECVEAARQTRQYVEICLQTLCAPAATLPPERKAAKDDFEWKQPLHVLKPLREVCCWPAAY